MLAHTCYGGATPLGAGQFVGFDGDWPVQAFYGHVPRPSRLDFFSLRTLVRSLRHFPACFRASYTACRSQPEPGSSEPGVMHISQGMPGLPEVKAELCSEGGGRVGQAAASTQGRQQRSDQIKAIPAPAAHRSDPNYVNTEAIVDC